MMTEEDVSEITKLDPLYAGVSPIVDIIAVENLSEEYLRCWTLTKESSEPIMWLNDPKFLPHDFPKSRIFSFGYQFGEESSPRTLAESLLQALVSLREDSEVVSITVNFNAKLTYLLERSTHFSARLGVWRRYMHAGRLNLVIFIDAGIGNSNG
jgi:hypothetical protein